MKTGSGRNHVGGAETCLLMDLVGGRRGRTNITAGMQQIKVTSDQMRKVQRKPSFCSIGLMANGKTTPLNSNSVLLFDSKGGAYPTALRPNILFAVSTKRSSEKLSSHAAGKTAFCLKPLRQVHDDGKVHSACANAKADALE